VRKVKQIKEKEDENSLFDEMKIKSQAAMEYLMTYGWAILIIALTLAVLYSLGIMNPKNFVPRAPPGSCFVFRPNGPGTTDFVSLQGTCGYLPMYVASANGTHGCITTPIPNIVGDKTIVGWIYPNKNSRATIYTIDDSDWGYRGWALRSDGTVLAFRIGNGSTGQNVYSSGGCPVYLRWNFVAATYNRTSNSVVFYCNGNKDGPKYFTIQPVQWYTSGAILGEDCVQNEVGLNGFMANVQVYNTILTPQEIQYLYQQGLGGAPVRLQNLVAWWPLNGDAKDYSGNNNHGKISYVTFIQNYNPP